MIDIPAPDVYTDERTMAWIFDTYDMMHPGQNNLPVVTGKPLELGGSLGRSTATARGALVCVEEAIGRGLVPGVSRVAEAKVAVQGFGNAGAHFADLSSAQGATLVAASATRRADVASPAGLDVAALLRHKARPAPWPASRARARSRTRSCSSCDCDVLVPAALENEITGDNAERIRAKLVAEAANGPTTPVADEILHSRGVVVLPDILCNGGGVTVSYYEWVQNLQDDRWDEETVNGRLRRRMARAFHAVYDIARDRGVDPRTAAYILAVGRVARVTELRGIWP